MSNSATGSYAQFMIVLLIFVGVLLVTFFVTKWMAGYQKGRGAGTNIEMIESAPLTSNKHIQIVRLGTRYVALAVSKDTVETIMELDGEDLILGSSNVQTGSFKEIISKLRGDETEALNNETDDTDRNE